MSTMKVDASETSRCKIPNELLKLESISSLVHSTRMNCSTGSTVTISKEEQEQLDETD